MSSEDIIKELTCKQVHVQSSMHDHVVDSTESHIELALKKADLYLCQCLLADQAVLLPTLYKCFRSFLPKNIECPSKAQLLTYIGNEFGDFMSSVCHHRKIGRIFFQTKSDPHVLLPHALPVNTPHQMTHRVLTKSITVLLHVLIRSTNRYTELYHTC